MTKNTPLAERKRIAQKAVESRRRNALKAAQSGQKGTKRAKAGKGTNGADKRSEAAYKAWDTRRKNALKKNGTVPTNGTSTSSDLSNFNQWARQYVIDGLISGGFNELGNRIDKVLSMNNEIAS